MHRGEGVSKFRVFIVYVLYGWPLMEQYKQSESIEKNDVLISGYR